MPGGHGHARCRRFDHHHVVTGHQHQDVRGRPAQHRTGDAIRLPAAGRDRAAQSERPGHTAIGQPGQPPTLLRLVPTLRDHGRGQHGGQEGPRRGLAPQLVEHHHQLQQSGARAPVRLRQVDAQPPQLRHLAPVRRARLVVGLEQRAGSLQSLVRREDAPDAGP